MGRYRFDNFLLDTSERRLWQGDEAVELNARYLDALALLVREQGRLVSKDRFLEEVWHGVAVTDEALTQCIRTLRRQLGDNATRPRFIETVPKHGYRFVAPVAAAPAAIVGMSDPAPVPADANGAAGTWLLIGVAGACGGAVAGVLGGLLFGLAGTPPPSQPGFGAASMLLVLVSVCALVGTVGAAGISFGIAAAAMLSPARPWKWSVAGAALGGLLVGAVAKLLGLDAFNLLLGHSPGNFTGAPEGMALGGAVGLGLWLANRDRGTALHRRSVWASALAAAAAGVMIPLLGGRLMGGSLDLLSRSFPDSRLRLDRIGALFGEAGFGPVSQAVVGCLEGALFGACIVAAMRLGQPFTKPRRNH